MASSSSSSSSLLVLILLQVFLRNKSFASTAIETSSASNKYVSAIGDPGMMNPNVRVALEAWNFCNEVGFQAPNMPSPRLADCADFSCHSTSDSLRYNFFGNTSKCEVHHKVNDSDNSLGAGDKFPIPDFISYEDPDMFAVQKELYLASLCEVHESSNPWQFWMIMLKNGNFDKTTTLCPENGKKVSKIVTDRNFPCFGEGCMNQPLIYHNYSHLVYDGKQNASLKGAFYGTYDLDADLSKGIGKNSYFSVIWQKNLSTGSWIFSNKLTTSAKYPWLMLYLRSDATQGFNGGYHYNGSGIMRKVCLLDNLHIHCKLNSPVIV